MKFQVVAAVFAAALVLSIPARSQSAQEAAANRNVTAFRDISVIPMDTERVLPHQTVLVRNGKIVDLGPAGSVHTPSGSIVIDGRGKFLIPGLADMHIHFQPSRTDNELMLRLFLANGITTVLNMYGTRDDLALRSDVAAEHVLGPTIFTSGPFISNAPHPPPSPDEVEAVVIRQKQAGYDLIKIHGDFSREGYRRLFEVARREGLRVAGHAPRNLGIQPMLEEHQDMVAHVEEYIYAYFSYGLDNPAVPADADEKIRWLASATARAGTWVTPTLTAYKGISRQVTDINAVLDRPEVALLSPSLTHDWRPPRNPYLRFPRNDELTNGLNRLLERTTKAFQEAGVPLLAGTDTPIPCVVPGFSLQDELEELVGAGLHPFDALRASTANAGKFLGSFLGRQDTFGLIKVGMRADLILLDANPLTDIRNSRKIAGVMVRGRWIGREELVQLLRAASREQSRKEQ